MRSKNIHKQQKLLIVNNLVRFSNLSNFSIRNLALACFCWLLVSSNYVQAQQCNITCNETVGGQSGITSWNKVKFYTKGIQMGVDNPNHDVDLLSTYTMGGVGVISGVTSHGVGVVGPTNDAPNRWNEINYFAEIDRSEKLLIEFPNCSGFTGANITLSRFYALESGDKGEAGCWRAFDADFNQVGGGTFFASQPSNAGLYNFEIRTAAPYRYLEFTAKPYSVAKTYRNNSDYLVQRIVPTCFTIPTCDDLIGGNNEFSSWQQVVISTRESKSNMFRPANAGNFVPDGPGLPGSNGLGVPNDSEAEINFDPLNNASEALRLDLGAKFTSAQFTVARLFKGEQGFYKLYNIVGCDLVEVGSGTFEGDENSDGTLKGGGVTGQRTVTVSTTDDFQIVEFTSGPTQSDKSNKDGEEEEEEVVGSGYVLHRFVPCPECSSGAYEVVSYAPGFNKDGSAIAPEFKNTENAIGAPQDLDINNPVNFVSLGFDGSITLKFALPFTNGVGPDLQIFETSSNGEGKPSCESNPEKADVFASQNGINYFYLGTICQDGSLDLGSQLNWAWYVKIIDASKRSQFWDNKANGFDLDGIKCLNGPEKNPIPREYDDCHANYVKTYAPGKRKNGTNMSNIRGDENKALGEPDSFDTFANATSLGFGDGRTRGSEATSGYIDLGYNQPIFDQVGNDILVIETSFANPQFRLYPEQAEVYASKDGIEWVLLGRTNTTTPAINCQITLDTEFDFAGKITWAQFIKVVDVTDPNAIRRRSSDCNTLAGQVIFGNLADAFDVDAVVCSNIGGDKKKSSLSRGEVRKNPKAEIQVLKAYPNPAVDYITLDFSESSEFVLPDDNKINVKIFTTQGRLVQENTTQISGDFDSDLNIANLPKGMYILKLEAGNSQKTLKFIK
jgi:hypothetical protein